jgi:hypothetical protein
MKLIKVFLDDERTAPVGWIRVTTAKNAIYLLKYGNVEIISLDHDLGTEDTGYDVILWIERKVAEDGMIPPKIKIHSANAGVYKKMILGVDSIKRIAMGSLKDN